MKKILYSIAITLCLWSCAPSTTPNTVVGSPDPSHSSDLFTLPDAEKILGEAAGLSESESSALLTVSTYRCSYKAKQKDEVSGKTGAIYLVIEQFQEIEAAKNKYTSIKSANAGHEGIKDLERVGDEAYFHSDGTNFYFIMARKGTKVLVIKVNKITSHTSLEEFNSITKRVVEGL